MRMAIYLKISTFQFPEMQILQQYLGIISFLQNWKTVLFSHILKKNPINIWKFNIISTVSKSLEGKSNL